MKKRILALFLTFSIIVSGLTSCSFSRNTTQSKYKEFLTIDVYDYLANYQGIQAGWFAKIVKDKFNMELNIIAPNVSNNGDTLFQSLSAVGDLGDLIICGGDNGNIQKLVSNGLLYNMKDLITDKDIMQYEHAISSANQDVTPEGIYAIPSQISSNDPSEPSEVKEPTFGPYLRWDIYKQIGYPEMETLEDMLDVLKAMQDAYPYTESGAKTYGFSFFSDWDGNLMNAVKQPCCFYGYDEYGFVLAKADGTDYQSILDDSSLYYRVLKLYFNANQMGLVDPDSWTQTYSTLSEKYKDGTILYTPWPWQGQSYFNTITNEESGKGYMLATIDDMQIYSYGYSDTGNSRNVICVGSNAQDPERMVDFIDWLYSTEGVMDSLAAQTNGAAGPQGLTWDLDENGEPYLTEFGRQALMNGEQEVPEEWGGGTWSDGISCLNLKTINLSDVSPEGYTYAYDLWDSELERNETAVESDWREQTGYNNTLKYLIDNNMLLVSPGCSYSNNDETSEVSTIRKQCNKLIVSYSWNMVFASSEEEFNRLWANLKANVTSLGYNDVLEIDLKNAKACDDAKKEAVANAQ